MTLLGKFFFLIVIIVYFVYFVVVVVVVVVVVEVVLLLFFVQRIWWIPNRVFRENVGGVWLARNFGISFKEILYVQMLVSFEHVVAAMVSELLKEKDTVLSRSLC